MVLGVWLNKFCHLFRYDRDKIMMNRKCCECGADCGIWLYCSGACCDIASLRQTHKIRAYWSDQPVPDQPVPDQPVPDQPVPDQSVPDQLKQLALF